LAHILRRKDRPYRECGSWEVEAAMDPQQPSEATTLHLPERSDDVFVREDLAREPGDGLASTESIAAVEGMGSVASTEATDGDAPTYKHLAAARRRWPVAVVPFALRAPRRVGRTWGRTPLGGRIAAGLLLAALVAALVFAVVRNLPPDLATSRATIGTLNVSFTTTGTLQSAAYDVNFGTQGKVAEIDVKVGQSVTQGQTLAKLDTKLLQDAVNSAQARVQAAQSSLSDAQATQAKVQAQTQAALAAAAQQETTAEAACKADDTTCVSRAQNTYSQAQAQADAQNAAAQAAVTAAQSQLTVAQGDLQTAQDGLANATLTAPHDGTVAQIFGTVGTAVGPGNGAAFIHLVDLGSLQLVAQVSANDVGAVQAQQAARFTVPTFTGRTFLGAVDTISPVGAPSGGVTRYPVTIDVDMNSVDGARLLPGMAATVTITTYSRIGVLTIPARAVAFAKAAGDAKHGGFLPKGQVQKAQRDAQQLLLQYESAGSASGTAAPTPTYVLERTKDNKWVAVPVLLGQTDGNVYEVLSAGMPGSLKKGDTVVTDWRGGPVTPPTPTPAIH